ncbi:MAG: hypothetical protein ACI9N1_001375 [Flavobacteriales bacterium]|jgi:hypothetical protein
MKQLFFFIALSLISALTYAQTCDMFFPLEEGASWEITHYNAKGKEQDTQVNTIISKKTVDQGEEASIKMEVKDAKEKDQVDIEYTVLCAKEYLEMDITMFTPDNKATETEGIEVEMTTKNLEFPNILTEGLELAPGSMKMTTTMNGIKVSSMEINIIDRKVAGIETITTPAGTFECFKITQTSKFKMGFMKFETSSITYFAKNVGIVKTENYDKKGKLDSYQELTKIN